MMDDNLVRKTIAARPFFLAVSKSLELSTNLSISTLASGKTCGPAAGIAVTTCSRIRWTKLKFDNWQLIVKEMCNIWINSLSVKLSEIKSHFLTKIKENKGSNPTQLPPPSYKPHHQLFARKGWKLMISITWHEQYGSI